jgi:hypothetical protein
MIDALFIYLCMFVWSHPGFHTTSATTTSTSLLQTMMTTTPPLLQMLGGIVKQLQIAQIKLQITIE